MNNTAPAGVRTITHVIVGWLIYPAAKVGLNLPTAALIADFTLDGTQLAARDYTALVGA